MSTLFISDLHLQSSQPHLTQLFVNFLEKYAKSADALYILGDLFEAWVGDDDSEPFKHEICNLLRNYSQMGIPLYFMPGNRDFLLNQTFAQKLGMI